MTSHKSSLKLQPHYWATGVLLLATPTIVVALSLVHFIPWRFRIHPLPYLSDAGLRDPERVILSFGLSLAAVSFIPVAIGLRLTQEMQLQNARGDVQSAIIFDIMPSNRRYLTNRRMIAIPIAVPYDLIPCLGMKLGFLLSFFLALFSSIPGWFFLHHVFAAFFALSAASWCLCHTLVSHATSKIRSSNSMFPGQNRLVFKNILVLTQFLVVCTFGIVWLSIKLQIPYRMIPNKDFRFVILACLEYVGAGAFLIYIAIVGRELKKQGACIRITMEQQEDIESRKAFRDK